MALLASRANVKCKIRKMDFDVQRRRQRPQIYINLLAAGRIFRDRLNPLDFDDRLVRERYRLERNTIVSLAELIDNDISFDFLRNSPFSSVQQPCITLRFLVTGTFYLVLGDLKFISKS